MKHEENNEKLYDLELQYLRYLERIPNDAESQRKLLKLRSIRFPICEGSTFCGNLLIETKILEINDLEELNHLAKDTLSEVKSNGYKYDEEGKDILYFMSKEEIDKAKSKNNNYWEMVYSELGKIPISDTYYMDLNEIKGKYLQGILKKARGMMKKYVSDEIDDEYLDNLIAITFKETLNKLLYAVLFNPEGFSLVGFDEAYSLEEKDFLYALKEKFLLK